MKDHPLVTLSSLGQSIWLDYIRRNLIRSGELQKLIDEDHLRGVTSNPAIFEKAIGGSNDYDEAIRTLAREGKSIQEIYQALTVKDVQMAADLFRPVYDRLEDQDGLVSLEVNPHLAHDTHGTISEARRLWQAVDRPNVLIKVPATRGGVPAIKQLISEGINVNVTLLFGLPRYRQVADAYLSGLEERAAKGQPLARVASVASFFLSRIDVLVDPLLEHIRDAGGPQAKGAEALVGEVAVASAKAAYSICHQIFGSERFKALAPKGARPQRLLWASTSTKNPRYSDVKYVEALIGPETINTVPLETLNAYRDHGHPAPRLLQGPERAASYLQRLPEMGIDLEQVTQQLEDEGVEKFIQPYDALMSTLEEKRREAMEEYLVDRQTLSLGRFARDVEQRLDRLVQERFCHRLWRKDASLWKKEPQKQKGIKEALGWLHVGEKMATHVPELENFRKEVRAAGFRHVVHMGMGGSSLAPLAFQRTFAPGPEGLPLTVLDTTDPATIREIETRVPLEQTLFLVASKSGTTAEPLAFMEYFYARLRERKGAKAGQNFGVITDPGTPLEQTAKERGFRRSFLNFRDLGGRYSALSYFGLVPAALMDLDIEGMLSRALRMMHACASCVAPRDNPGLVLGAILGELALQGRDKMTLVTPASLSSLGMWLEQLLAESTGKEGTGLLPVAGETLGAPALYGDDRVFVHFRLAKEGEDRQEQAMAALRAAGQPVVTIRLADRLDLAQEMFRWEVATAVAGAILGINAFNQPNVQESKDNTNRLMREFQEKGRLPEEKETLAEGPVSLYTREGAPTVVDTLRGFFKQAHPGDYVALLAYLTEAPAVEQALQDLRLMLRDRLHLATTLGYGPRYLHSTGQLHKGGPNKGIFLEITADEPDELPVPQRPYTFGVFKRAQALGDLESLRRHGRRVMRVHLHGEVPQALSSLKLYVESALSGGES